MAQFDHRSEDWQQHSDENKFKFQDAKTTIVQTGLVQQLVKVEKVVKYHTQEVPISYPT